MTRYSNSPPDPSSAGKESIPASSPGTDTIFSEALSTQEVEQAVYHAAENDLSLLGLFKQSVPFSPLTGDRAQAILSHQFSRASVEEMNLLLSCTDVQTIREWVSDFIDFIIMRDTLLIRDGDEFLQEEKPKPPVDQALKDLLNDFRKLERIAQIVDELLGSYQQSSPNTPTHSDKGRTPLEMRQDALRNSEKFSAFQDSYRFDANQHVFAQREGPVTSYPIFGAEHPQDTGSWGSLREKYNVEEFNELLNTPENLSYAEKQFVSQRVRQTLLKKTTAFLAEYKTDLTEDVFSNNKATDLVYVISWFKTLSDNGIIAPEDSLHLTMELKRLVLPHLSQVVAPTESTTRKGNPALWAVAVRLLKRGESALPTQGPNGGLMSIFEQVLRLCDTFSDTQILQLSAVCRKQGAISSIVSGGNNSDLEVIREAFKIFTNSPSGVPENVGRLVEILDSSLIDKRVMNVQLAALAERTTAELSREFLRGEFDNPSEIAWQASALCKLVRGRIPEEDVKELESLVDAIFLGESTVPDESKWWSSHKSRGLLFINAWKDSLESPNTLDIRRAVILTTIARESGTGLIEDLNKAITFTGEVIYKEAFTNEMRQRILRALSGLPLQKACDFIKSFSDCFPGILEPASIDPLALYSAIACNPFARSAILGPLESNEFTTFLELLNYIKTHSSISAPRNLALNLLCALFSSPGFSEEKLPQIHSLLGTTGSVEEIFSQYERMKNYYLSPSGTSRALLPITSSQLKDAVDSERVILCTNIMPMHGTSSHPYQGIFVFSDNTAKQMFVAELIESSESSYSSESNATPEHSLELSLTSPYTETITEDIVPNGTQRIALSDDLWGLILEVTGWCKERLLYNARRGRSDTNWRD